MEEIILSSEEIYNGRVVKLALHQVRLPNGEEAKREVVRHPGAVAIVAFDANGDVLLVRQFRLAAGKILSEIPAGTLNPGEDPLECAIRELQEETGYKPGKIEALGGIYVAPGYTTEYIHLFLATDLIESKLAQDIDEFLEVDHVPFKDALAMIERGDMPDGKSNVALLRVARRMGV
jgi:ADP-ribose pyrophosphatase